MCLVVLTGYWLVLLQHNTKLVSALLPLWCPQIQGHRVEPSPLSPFTLHVANLRVAETQLQWLSSDRGDKSLQSVTVALDW